MQAPELLPGARPLPQWGAVVERLDSDKLVIRNRSAQSFGLGSPWFNPIADLVEMDFFEPNWDAKFQNKNSCNLGTDRIFELESLYVESIASSPEIQKHNVAEIP